MDTIEFRIRKSKHSAEGVSVFINGTDLIQLAREHELPMCKRENAVSIAGGYAPLSKSQFRKDHTDVLAGTHYKPKLSLFCCRDCGEIGCWPLDVTITEEGEEVIWSDFEQPHRRGKWDYSTFGPFHFDKTQYQTALKAAGLQRVPN